MAKCTTSNIARRRRAKTSVSHPTILELRTVNKVAIEAADAWWALALAKHGDWKDIANRVRSGANLSSEERVFVADIIDGKIKRAKHRPASFEASSLQYEVATHVIWAEMNGDHTEPAVAQAMQQFQMSRSGVYEALKKFRKPVENFLSELRQFKAAAPVLNYWYRTTSKL